LSCETIQARHISGPARIVIVTFEKGRSEDLYYTGNGITGTVLPADCLAGLSDVRVVQSFPDEGLKVLEAEVAAGTNIALRR
jgi:hypothetical protein